MVCSQKLTLIGRAIAIGSLALATTAIAQTEPITQTKQVTVETPRQNWASTDGVIHLQPAQVITPASIADRLMIQDQFERWGVAYDEGRLDVVRSLFTPEGELEILAGSAKPERVVKGVDAIVQAVIHDRAGQHDQRRHAISNVVINQLDETRATATAYGVVTAASDGTLYLGASVIYRGDLKKQLDGMWRFERFVIGLDAYARRPTAAAPTAK